MDNSITILLPGGIITIYFGIDVAKVKHDRFIGSKMPAKPLELRLTIHIRELDKEIDEVEASIEKIMTSIQSPITTIPGMGLRMGAMILAEVGDFANFNSPYKILAYASLSPSTYESRKLSLASTYSHMEKRGSRYLRYAIFNATKFVYHWDPTFAAYLAKKRADGKNYNVAISHAAKKLVRSYTPCRSPDRLTI